MGERRRGDNVGGELVLLESLSGPACAPGMHWIVLRLCACMLATTLVPDSNSLNRAVEAGKMNGGEWPS